MIFDQLKNAQIYFGLGERIEKGFKFLIETDFANKENGKYDIDGEDAFAIVDSYNSKTPEMGKWEAHKKYLDIQLVAEGTEKIGFGKMKDMTVTQEYNDEKDIMFLTGKGDFVTVEKGYFMILFPDDIHMPGMAIDNPSPVKKVVVKVKL